MFVCSFVNEVLHVLLFRFDAQHNLVCTMYASNNFAHIGCLSLAETAGQRRINFNFGPSLLKF